MPISDATRELVELRAHVDALLDRMRPALARANKISDGIDETNDPCPFWDATGLSAFSLLVPRYALPRETPARHAGPAGFARSCTWHGSRARGSTPVSAPLGPPSFDALDRALTEGRAFMYDDRKCPG
jgi:hypothetical protein